MSEVSMAERRRWAAYVVHGGTHPSLPHADGSTGSDGWRQALSDEYWNPASWRTSPKGNPYVSAGGKPVTIYRRDDGWHWSIGRSVKAGGPIYSDGACGTVEHARRAAWDVLVVLVKPPERIESSPMQRDADAPPVEPPPRDWVRDDEDETA